MFTGFSPQGLRFLRDLAKNNDRQWFTRRKHVYETELLEPSRDLISDANAAMRKAKIPLGGDPKRSAFRIYRDVRFSPDKSPYKTNVGIYLSYDGTHHAPGGLYVHVQPKQSFMAAGFYEIEKALLGRWREAMAKDPKQFETVLRALDRAGLNLSEEGTALKRMPRGFEGYAQSPLAKYFRVASFIVSEKLTDEDIGSARLIERMVSFTKRAKPLLEYGWRLV